MRSEKQQIRSEYLSRLNGSPFFIVVDYRKVNVGQFTELRKRLNRVGAEVHVVKNSIFRLSAKEAGIELAAVDMTGQLAVVTGQREISATAKVLKNFKAEFDRPEVKLGYLDSKPLRAVDVKALADLPSLEVLRSMLLGVIQAPAARLARLLNTPATQLAYVLKAKAEKVEMSEKAE